MAQWEDVFFFFFFLLRTERVLTLGNGYDEGRTRKNGERGRVNRQNNPWLSVLKPNAFITTEPLYPLAEQTQQSLLPRQRRWSYSNRIPVRSGWNFSPLSSHFSLHLSAMMVDASVCNERL